MFAKNKAKSSVIKELDFNNVNVNIYIYMILLLTAIHTLEHFKHVYEYT